MKVDEEFVLPDMSVKQLEIVESLRHNNVITSSVAGSGKTTLALHVVQVYTSSKFLIVTYNRSLSQDCNAKIKLLNLTERVKCYTYHALMAKLCNQNCFNDNMFLDLLHNNIPLLLNTGFDFDALIVDEMQDQRQHHYLFLKRLLTVLRKDNCRFLFIGDPRQLLYDFYKTNPADRRYLELSNELYSSFSKDPFKRISLSTSFRTTPKICEFVNYVCKTNMLAGNMHSKDERVNIVICNIFKYDIINYIYKIILKEGQDNVMFLCNTVSKSPTLRNITNALRNRGINFYVSRNDYEQNNSDLLKKGKVVVETYCGVKGLERKCIILFGLDYTKSRYDDKENQIYVALTRSCGGQLHIIHSHHYDIPWLLGINPNVVKVVEFDQISIKNPNTTTKIKKDVYRTFNINTVLDFIDSSNLDHALQCLTIDQVSPSRETYFNSVVRFGKHVEDTRVIVAKALPMMMEFEFTGKCLTVELLLEPIISKDEHELEKMVSKHGTLPVLKSLYEKHFPADKVLRVRQLYTSEPKSSKDWLEMANAVLSYQNYSHMLSQIRNYDWFQVDTVLLKGMITKAEPKTFNEHCQYLGDKYCMKGNVDVVTSDGSHLNLEFSPQISIEHVLKAALRLHVSDSDKSYVYNIQTDQMLMIKFKNDFELTDFIVNCKKSDDDTDKIDDLSFLDHALRC
jgi:hypothetical protein